MRDGIVLRADVYRPETEGRFPVLVYRTPYGKHNAAESYQIHLKAVARGYVVVLQDVRGRYASDGRFNPYRQEGADGFDTIEWAAQQPWSNGVVGTYGLSYPGAVQWLAAMEAPPQPRGDGARDDILVAAELLLFEWRVRPLVAALDLRQHRAGHPHESSTCPARVTPPRRPRPGRTSPTSTGPGCRCGICRGCARKRRSTSSGLRIRRRIRWWDWAELRGRYAKVTAAVLNLSGWYDEGYGPEGAVTNFNGLVEARAASGQARTHLILGPWMHGVGSTGERKSASSTSGPRPRSTMTRSCSTSSIITCAAYVTTTQRPRRYAISSWAPTNGRAPRAGRLRTPGPCRCTSTGRRRRRLLRFEGLPGAVAGDLHRRSARSGRDPYDEYGPHDYRRSRRARTC